MIQDIRSSIRSLRRSPGFALIAVLTLALGIGANSAIFSVVNGVLLQPLPYPESDRLVRVYSLYEGDRWTASPSDWVDWRRESRTLQDVGGHYRTTATLSGAGPAQRVSGAMVTHNLLSVLGVSPALGRSFGPEDALPGQDRVAIIGHRLWQDRFGGDPDIVGRTVVIGGASHVIVGVMPVGFEYPEDAELWRPLAFTEEDLADQRGAHYLSLVGRLQPDRRIEDASTEIQTLAARIEEAYPETSTGWSATVVGLRESIVGDVRPALLLLLGAVGLVLLIACANVANLVLVKALERDRELAVRAALGASRYRLLRGLLVESLVLATLGGAAGLLLAQWGTDVLKLLGPEDIPRLGAVGIDGTVLAFTGGTAIFTAILFGLLPGLRAAFDRRLRERLTEGGRGLSAQLGTRRARSALVVGEIALAVMLVTGALLLIKSFVRLNQVDPGFRHERLLTLSVSLPDARYPEPAQAREYFRELTGRVEALPGVVAADAVFGLPLSGFFYSMSIHEVDGQRPPRNEEPSVQLRIVTPGYFHNMGIPLVEGREFLESDRADAPLVAMVNESAARLLWEGADPLGRSFSLGTHLGLGGPRVGGTVVGIVRDFKHFDLDEAAPPEAYFVHSQFPVEDMSLAVRTTVPPASLAGPVTDVVREMDPEVPPYSVLTMEQRLRESIAQPRFYMLLLAIFAGTALALAAVGIYGVIAHTVTQRTRELGIRIALGARQREVLRMVLAHGLALGATGVVIGTLIALATTRTLAGLLFEVAPTDLATFIAVPAFLLAVTLVACWLPARRATRIDPVEALRAE